MKITLAKEIAQKLVETVKDVCGHDINYIDPKGMIVASTNKSRIGNFHEIGYKAAETGEIIEVQKDEDYLGTKKGVNIPFFYKRKLIAVIGISGDPDQVRSYAYLIQRIATMILKERELEEQNHGLRNEIHYFLRSLVENESLDFEELKRFFAKRNLSMTASYRMVVIDVHSHHAQVNISMMEERIYRVFDQIADALYIFRYPREFWLMVEADSFEKNRFRLEKIAQQYTGVASIGVGTRESLSGIHLSHKAAMIAIKSASEESNLIMYDDLTLEILLGNIEEDARKRYEERTIKALSEEELIFLRTYFDSALSLQLTAERLFIHKNTVQYKLNRIYHLTGLNPRSFQDAVILYLATQLKK